MLPQASQELPDQVSGTLAGTSISGGAAGLERVVGAGPLVIVHGEEGAGKRKIGAGKAGAGKAGAGVAGAGVVSDLRIPIISDIARIFGLGKKAKKQGRKSREDEKLAMEVKGIKDKKGGAYVDPMFGVINTPLFNEQHDEKKEGGAYVDPMFGVINQPAGSSEKLAQVAGEGPLGSGYKGGAKHQGEKMAKYLHELHGDGYAREFAGGFWGALASLAAPLIGKLISGNGMDKKWIQEAVSEMKEGAFTQQALRHKMTPLEFMEEVLAHPEKYTIKTRRRAQFLKNIHNVKRGGMMNEDDWSDEELRGLVGNMGNMTVEERRDAEADAIAEATAARAAAASPVMQLPIMAQLRRGAPLPAAAGETAVRAAAAAAAPAPRFTQGAVRQNLFSPAYIGAPAPVEGLFAPLAGLESPASLTPESSPSPRGYPAPGSAAAAAAAAAKPKRKGKKSAAPASAAAAAAAPAHMYSGKKRMGRAPSVSPAAAAASSSGTSSDESPKPKKETKKPRGGAKPGDKRAARAAIVKKVMMEQGLSLPQASKYVKVHNLF